MTSPVALVSTLCAALILIMFGFMPVAAVLPGIFADWNITETEAGWLSGIYFGGYALGVPILLPLTDRIDARRVLLGAALLCAISGLGFAWFADGLWSGILFRVIGGIGLAGFHFPGMKLIADRLDGSAQQRGSATYISMFSVGGAVSFLGAGLVETWFGWKAVFTVSGWTALIALFLVLLLIRPVVKHESEKGTGYLNVFAVLRNREALRYIAAYFGHVWEIFAMRGWSVAVLAFSASLPGNEAFANWNFAIVSGAISLLMMPTSVGLAELSARFGRVRIIMVASVATTLLALLLAAFNTGPFVLVLVLVAVYFMAGFGDTATMAAGVVAASDPVQRGATLAVYALVGFIGGMVGPVAFGIVLDAAGGRADPAAWSWAFGSMLVATFMVVVPLHWRRRR